MKTLIAVLLLASCVAGQDRDKHWQRVKDCAAQAEKWDAKNGNSQQQHVMSNHYNDKADRCWLDVFVRGDHAGDWTRQLIDTYENSIEAWSMVILPPDLNPNKPPTRLCGIGASLSSPCPAVDRLFEEALTQ